MSDLISALLSYFSYKFVLYAFIVGALVSLCASLLGVSLVLKRCSMIGDGLSHVSFGALAIAAVLGFAPLVFSIPIVIVAAVILIKGSQSKKISGDSAIAMISSASLALGVIVISLTKGMNTDISSYMFGSLTAMSETDVVLSIVLSVLVLVFYFFFFNRIFAITFDESFARASGIKTGRLENTLAVVTAVTIVIGMRVIGAMLISALVIFPALTAMRLFKSFRSVCIAAAIISVACAFIGICLSCLFSIPTGASIVASNAAAFCIFSLIDILKRRFF